MNGLLRFAAALVLVAVLTLLVSTEGPKQLGRPVSAQPLPVVDIDTAHLFAYKDDILPVALCLLEPSQSALGEAHLEPATLYLLVIQEGALVDLINIPVGTRVSSFARAGLSSKGLTPREAYVQGLSAGEEEEKLLASVGDLFFGIPIERLVLVTRRDMALVLDAVQGVTISPAVDEFSAVMAGGVALFEGPSPDGRTMRLGTSSQIELYTSGNSRSVDTDTGALNRQNHVLASLVDQLARSGTSLSAVQEMCEGGIRHNLSGEELALFERAFSIATYARLEEEVVRTLKGDQRQIEGQNWLPDRAAIKEYVLLRFYEGASSF